MQVLPELITGGVERGTVDIAEALVQAGHKAIVVSNGGPLVADLNALGAQHIELSVHSKNPFIIRRNAHRLASLARSLNVEVIHARSRAPAWSCHWATREAHIPFVTTFHGTYGHSNRIKRWYNRVMCRGDHTIAVSNYISDHIQTVYGKPQGDLSVIHRGVDMDSFDPVNLDQKDLLALRQKWKVPEGKKVILVPGRLSRRKGQLDFIEAFAKLNNDDLFALIVGSDQGRDYYSEELLARIDRHCLSDKIILCGHHRDMALAYAISDIVVAASNEPEAFGRVACEAQAMGCLVVATQHGGAKETIAPCQKAWQCEPKSQASMTGALEKAIAVQAEQKELVANESRKFIQQHFSLTQMCSATLQVYEEVAQNRG